MYKVAVLTVSDTAAADPSADKSGRLITELLQAHTDTKFQIVQQGIVPDARADISSIITGWSASGEVDWIITTGGTGFGVRDCTPEAISPLIERPASGLVHALLNYSLTKTPLAALSRPVAGTRNKTLIITLPGSPKAVKENMELLLANGLAAHALDLICGGSGKKVHAAMGAGHAETKHTHKHDHARSHDHSHSHGHEHGHGHGHSAPRPRTVLSHDPSLPVSARHRQSPYPLITLEEAKSLVLKHTPRLKPEERKLSTKLGGYVLAEDVYSPQNVPFTTTTNVDGYALHSSTVPGTYKVLSPQQHSRSKPLPPEHVYRVNTGSPLPPGTDAVIMVEDTRLISTVTSEGDDNGEELEIETLAKVDAGENVRAPGSDTRKGDCVLEQGLVIGSGGGEIGTLAFVGRRTVKVFGKPVVAILSTGNEIADVTSGADAANGEEWAGIWDTNRPSLQLALEGLGFEVVDLGVVKDDVASHVEILNEGLASADVVLTTGGTSMGSTDLLKPVIERHLNGAILFGRVKVKPGKPTTFATVERDGKSKLLFALPGNPASALVCFYIFVLPALRKMSGWPANRCSLPEVNVILQDALPIDPRPEFHRVRICATETGLVAFSTGGQRSSRVASLSGANGFVAVPAAVEGGGRRLEKGSIAKAVVIGELESSLTSS